MRIAVVEDNDVIREQMKNCLARYAGETGEALQTEYFADGLDILDDFHAQYDLIFLDIQLTNLDGMTTAERIRQADEEVMIVFVTRLEHFAVQGYAVGALDFILKPINYQMVKKVLLRAERLSKKRKESYVVLDTDQGLMRLSAGDIRYIEAQRHTLRVHTDLADYYLHDTMKNLEDKLAPFDFCRCHSGFLINLAHVNRAFKNTVTVDGEEIPIARPRQKEFMEQLTAHLGK